MNEKVKEILEDAGWYNGRQIEIDYLIEEIKGNDLTIPNEAIENFLKEFGNLEFNFVLLTGEPGNIKLVIDEVAPYIEPRNLIQWQNLAKENIVPVGTMFNDDAYLFISYSGKFYMANGNKFFLIGDDFFDCIDKVINQKNIIRITL
jgi:hypothetical protein